jgi:hypothetical protein
VNAIDGMESRFLEDAPTEIRDVLDWFNVEEARGVPPSHPTEFAGKFLGALRDDGAVLPDITEALDGEFSTQSGVCGQRKQFACWRPSNAMHEYTKHRNQSEHTRLWKSANTFTVTYTLTHM